MTLGKAESIFQAIERISGKFVSEDDMQEEMSSDEGGCDESDFDLDDEDDFFGGQSSDIDEDDRAAMSLDGSDSEGGT